jgi:segregation and condensation protein B
MIVDELMMHVEALVFASEKAITAMDITTIMAEMHADAEIDINQIGSCLAAIQEKYDSEYYPFTIKEIGGGFQFLTKKEFHTTIAKLNGDKFLKRLSTAALETLAIIAYKQPITKPDVEYIRGVNCDYSVQKLLEKELIVISGRNEDAVGKPLLYSTSKNFMDYLGLNSIDDLPRLKEVSGEDIVLPTSASEAIPSNDQTVMVVSGDGELQEIPMANEEIIAGSNQIADAPEAETETKVAPIDQVVNENIESIATIENVEEKDFELKNDEMNETENITDHQAEQNAEDVIKEDDADSVEQTPPSTEAEKPATPTPSKGANHLFNKKKNKKNR